MSVQLPAILDRYSLIARTGALAVVLFPAGLAAGAWFPGIGDAGSAVGGLGALVVALLAAHLGGVKGLNRQRELWDEWGGPPTTRFLRHLDSTINPNTKRRHHAKLSQLTGTAAPTAEEEPKNPAAADNVYESYVDFLRTKTRDAKRFPLVFQENVGYGFRRNVWGMKLVGVMVSLLAAVASAVHLWWTWKSGQGFSIPGAAGLAVSVVMLVLWFRAFVPKWVRTRADAYALRVIEASEEL